MRRDDLWRWQIGNRGDPFGGIGSIHPRTAHGCILRVRMLRPALYDTWPSGAIPKPGEDAIVSKIPDFSCATGREGKLALQVGWRQGGQDGQRYFPHGCDITLQGGNGRLECHHLLEGMPDPS